MSARDSTQTKYTDLDGSTHLVGEALAGVVGHV